MDKTTLQKHNNTVISYLKKIDKYFVLNYFLNNLSQLMLILVSYLIFIGLADNNYNQLMYASIGIIICLAPILFIEYFEKKNLYIFKNTNIKLTEISQKPTDAYSNIIRTTILKALGIIIGVILVINYLGYLFLPLFFIIIFIVLIVFSIITQLKILNRNYKQFIKIGFNEKEKIEKILSIKKIQIICIWLVYIIVISFCSIEFLPNILSKMNL